MAEVITITSGKGGVGKSTATANIAVGLGLVGQKVVAVDFDIGLRNLDMILGLENRIVYDVVDVMEGKCVLSQALIQDKQIPNLSFLPASQSKDKTILDKNKVKILIEELKKEFDYIIALGGARFSCLYRPKYVHDLIYSYGIKTKAVVLLSGMRPISDSERIATDTYAPHANTEYELINAGAEQTFNLSKNYKEEIYQNENPNKGWAVRTYDIISGMIPVYSVSGPSSEPEKRRANSADTYKFFLDRYNVHKGQKLLLVTSQIYVPYQQLEALRTLALPRGLYIETVGFPVEWASKMQGMMEPANYLQEIRSTIQAVNRYLDAVDY